MKIRAHLLTLPLMAFIATVAAADDEVVHRSHRFDGAQVRHLRIDHGVGTIVLERAESHTIEVELTIKPRNEGRRLARRPNLEDMDLTARPRGDQLTLAFDERNAKGEWIIRVPAGTELTIEQGVGTVEGMLPGARAFVDLGVGSVHLVAERSAVGPIELRAGVGDTRIVRGEAAERRRALVGSQSSARGEGAADVRVDVGVGEVEVQLN